MASSTGTTADVTAAAHALGKLQGTKGAPLSVDDEDDDDSAIRVVLSHAYFFKGKQEFHQLELDTNKHKKASLLKMYLKTMHCGFCEIPLMHCHNWYKDLRFAEAIDIPHENAGDMVWRYSLIILDTSATNLHHVSNKLNLNSLVKFVKMANAFYLSGFLANNPTTRKCIALALKTEVTIMVVARRMKASTPFTNFRTCGVGNMFVVAAITFRHCREAMNSSKIAAAVSWLNVSKTDVHPTRLTGWHRQGFGLFMIVAMIKYIASNDQYKTIIAGAHKSPEVSVYLQSYEPSAYHFYVMIGFKQLNKRFEDGFELLPIELQKSIERSADDHSRAPGTAVFHYYRRTESEFETETPAYQLMFLPYKALQHFRERTSQKQRSVVRPIWCQFPPPLLRGIRLHYTQTMLSQVFAKLPLINALLPELKSSMPASAFFEKGFMLVDRRLNHTLHKGKLWMSSAEIDLMNALLMIDGRYADTAFVLPSGYADAISEAYDLHVIFKRAGRLRTVMLAEKKSEDEIAKAMEDNFKSKLSDATCEAVAHNPTNWYDYICEKNANSMNYVLEKIIFRHPGLLKRRILVFPKCIDNHWSLVFVFNASYIEEQLDTGTMDCGLRPCFFRYCSIFPDGTRTVPVTYGIHYFLNLCFSFDKHECKPNKVAGEIMPMLEPFGIGERSVGSCLLGTKSFPALRITSGADNLLPKQIDAVNCGIGICAALGIVLRDLADPELFEACFATKNLTSAADDKEETYCEFPPLLTALPEPTTLPFGDYLTSMREQWFIVFDRMAKLQHETIPRGLFADYVVLDEYAQNRGKILNWPVDGKPTSANQDSDKKPAANPETPKPAEGQETTDAHKPKTDEKKAAEPETPKNKDDADSKEPQCTKPVDMVEVALRLPPSKRKVDWIEEAAFDLYEQIKKNDPEDAKGLEPIPAKWKEPAPKFCSQSEAETNAFHERIGAQFTAPERFNDDKFTEELEAYVDQSFRDWEWHSNEEHAAWIAAKQAEVNEPTRSKKSKSLIILLIRAVKAERQKYRTLLAREFKFTRSTLVKGLKYIKKNNSFCARLVWKAPPIPAEDEELDSNAEDVDFEEDMRVEEEWIVEEYGKEMVQHLINMRQTQQWNEVPRDVAVRIAKKKIVRVRYVKPKTVFVVDVKKLQDEQEADDAAQKAKASRKKRKTTPKKNDIGPANIKPDKLRPNVTQLGTPASPAAHKTPPTTPRKSKGSPQVVRNSLMREESENDASSQAGDALDDNDTKESPAMQTPKVGVKVGEKWLGKTEDGKETILDEQFVRMAFGEAFTNELKRSTRGFVDIPVGDSKPSHLYQHPELKHIGAPTVRFPQSEGKDLCVSKSLASALFALGPTWHDAALKIDAFGENMLQGTAVDALERVKTETSKHLPRWYQPKQLPIGFDWHSDLQERDILVGVLLASDGSCSHAVTIYGRQFVYDANEAVALPLCDEALNYCTSTEKVKSTFVRFKRGFFCRYEGKKPSKIAKVTHDIC